MELHFPANLHLATLRELVADLLRQQVRCRFWFDVASGGTSGCGEDVLFRATCHLAKASGAMIGLKVSPGCFDDTVVPRVRSSKMEGLSPEGH